MKASEVLVTDRELQQALEESFREPLWPTRHAPATDLKVTQPPASGPGVEALLARHGPLPAAYLDFLRESDGVVGCGSDREGDYLTLWGTADLDEGQAVAVARGLAELLLIGTDGQGGWVGFDRRTGADAEGWPIVRVGPRKPDRQDVRELAANFEEWRKAGFPLRPGGFVCGGG